MTRLLLINPNTTEAITDKVAAAVRAMAPSGLTVDARTGAFGPRYIASRATFAVAGHAALDAYARAQAEVKADAVLLACFGDPGLDALREVAPIPVIGLVEAAIAEASAGGRRFSIVTGGALWREMLEETMRVRRLDSFLAAIRTVAPTGGQIAADPEGALDTLAEACAQTMAQDGAQAIILGGAGLVGLAGPVSRRMGAPVTCSVEAGARAAFAAMAARTKGTPTAEAAPPIASIGLSPPLARLLDQG